MKDLGNKLLIYAVCGYLLWLTGLTPTAITAFTVALAASSLCTYWGDGWAVRALVWGYCLLSIRHQEFGLYLPLLLYDASCHSQIYTLPPILAAGIYWEVLLPAPLRPAYLFTAVLSSLLSIFSQKMDSLRRQLHQTKDEGSEVALALQERNRALIEQQDSEIRIATLTERNRIAREIHDNVGHLLTRSILQIGALKAINKEAALDESLAGLHDTLNTAMTGIRTSVHDLHDEAIDLSYVLTDIISHVAQPEIRLEYDMTAQVPREIKYAFIAIVKEAVSNMQKHSNASLAHITVREHPGFYHLQIGDNGTVTRKNTDRGIGLSNMEERVRALGGTIRFSTENGFGIYIAVLKKAT